MAMRVSKMLGERLKTAPEGPVTASQMLMIKGGYIKPVGSGIYSFFPPARRIAKKIEKILREEMDRIEGQEVLFPVVMPASLWEESGRYESVGSELLRFSDRGGNKMVLGMTHEEAAVHLARNTVKSYTQLPFMIYQIQTKFRDEPRSRAGLIRVREFTMKDAYSFHESQEDLEAYYARCYEAYERIFRRCGLKEVVAVASDSGMMGGKVSHEFMLLTDIGEDSIVISEGSDYRANMEVAQRIQDGYRGRAGELQKHETPEQKTIEDLARFLNVEARDCCKAVVYQKNADDSYVVVFLRGDLEVNETKLRNLLGCEVHPAVEIAPGSGIVPGFIGPLGLDGGLCQVFDASLADLEGFCCGANEQDQHYSGVAWGRDLPRPDFHDLAKVQDGDICPVCGEPVLRVRRGIEVGNIFQLGRRYSEAMGMQYVDAQNQLQTPIMGCYGIGVGRLIASVCEESHDDYGPIWPISIAPWELEVCNLRAKDEAVCQAAEEVVAELEGLGLDLLYDDRDLRPGSMFADADLLAAPIRVIVSPKNLDQGQVEIVSRDKRFRIVCPRSELAAEVLKLRRQLYAELEA